MLKPFLAQFGPHLGGGNISVSLGTAFAKKDGAMRRIAEQYRGTGSKGGCAHGFSSDEKDLLFKTHTGFLGLEPSLSGVRCGWHEEPGWPCCFPEFIARDG